ncbi:MAG: FKBP-type peptidyl-prolyl cis-trans isomerase [Prevotella sp.]|nr:FKBP-type peptidyl-prolyl cis-trans isomerase [Prevotella sp.]
MDKVSYALGIGIGRQLADMGANDIVTEDFAAAMKDVLTGAQLQIDETEAQAMVQEYLQKKGEERLKNVKAEGEAFLADNAKKEGIVTLPSGLQYQVLQEGNGKSPKATDQVKCHYEGTLINGKVFDSSYRRGEPATFPLNGVIAGWTEGLQLMKEGAKYRFFIPFNLAYGTRGAGQDIPPYATLIFDVELIEVK